MRWIRNLHQNIKFAFGLFVVEAFLGPLGAEFYSKYSGEVFKMLHTLAEWVPSGILAGLGLGLVASLWLLRGRTKDWYKSFDTQRSEYVDMDISISSLMREYINDKEYRPIRKKDFRNCRFEGPGVVYIMHGCTIGPNNIWHLSGTTIALAKGDSITGVVGFDQCHFEGCEFTHITPVVPEDLLEDWLNTFPPTQRPMVSPKKLIEKDNVEKSKNGKQVRPTSKSNGD